MTAGIRYRKGSFTEEEKEFMAANMDVIARTQLPIIFADISGR